MIIEITTFIEGKKKMKKLGVLVLLILIIFPLFLLSTSKFISAETEVLPGIYANYLYRTGTGNNSLYANWEINATGFVNVHLFTQNQFRVWNETISNYEFPAWVYDPPAVASYLHSYEGNFRINNLNTSELYYFVICDFNSEPNQVSFNLSWYWTPPKMISTPFKISSSGNATSPAIAVEENGNIHIVWDDLTTANNSGSDRDIFYRRWNASSGVWTGTNLVSNNSTMDSLNPAIAVDSDGNVHIVWSDWTDYGSSGSDMDIFYRCWNASTGLWNETQVISTESSEKSIEPAIAVDGNQDIHVTWVDDSSNDLVKYKFFNTTARVWKGQVSPTDQVSTELNMTGLYSPEIVADFAGNVYIVWGGININGPNSSIYFKYWNSTIKSWNGFINTTDCLSAIYQNKTCDTPSIALDTVGGVHVLWKDQYQIDGDLKSEISYKYWNSSNRVWYGKVNETDRINIYTEIPYFSAYPSITIDGNNNIHIVWSDDTPIFSYSKPGYSYDLYYRYWNASKNVWEPLYEISSESIESSIDARVGIDGNGNLHIVWNEMISNTDIYYKMVTGGYFDSSSVTHPNDQNFLHVEFKNTTGNEITWTVFDLWPYIQPVPQTYYVYNNTFQTAAYNLIQSGGWSSGDNITVNYDNSSWGLNNYTLIIDDGWRYIQDEVIIVLDQLPIIGIVEDLNGQHYVEGEEILKITFNVGGCALFNNPTYTIFENGIPIYTGEYTPFVDTTYFLSVLAVGEYNYTLLVDNGYGFISIYQMQFEITRSWTFYLLIFALVAIIAISTLAGYIYLKNSGIMRKKTSINIFISHAVADFEEYEIESFSTYLEKNKAINKVYYCEKDISFDIDQWMNQTIPKCQILLFIATESSLNSKDCARELQIARKNELSIIPVKGKNLHWSDLSTIKLERQFGFEFDKEIVYEFKKNIFAYISKFKEDLDKLLKLLNKSSISFISAIKSELNLSYEQIRGLTGTLIQLNQIQGAWDKNYIKFLSDNEIVKLVKAVDPKRTIKDVKKLVELTELSTDSIEIVANILDKKGYLKITKKVK